MSVGKGFTVRKTGGDLANVFDWFSEVCFEVDPSFRHLEVGYITAYTDDGGVLLSALGPIVVEPMGTNTVRIRMAKSRNPSVQKFQAAVAATAAPPQKA